MNLNGFFYDYIKTIETAMLELAASIYLPAKIIFRLSFDCRLSRKINFF